MSDPFTFGGIPIKKNPDPDIHGLFTEAIRQANTQPYKNKGPRIAFVGVDFMAKFRTQCLGIPTNQEQAREWLNENAEYDEDMGLWKLEML